MTSTPSKKTSYAAAGVDIDAGDRLVNSIKSKVKETNRSGANTDLGGFGGLFDLKATGYNDPVLVAATDGVGTKLKIAHDLNKHDTIGTDLVAMCVNDLIVQGAEPLFFLDYFATGKLSEEQGYEVIAGIADACKASGCALIGGETAEMPGMYKVGEYDLAGFSVGAVERDAVLPKKDAMNEGDVLIGLASSGVHSNGFSLVRYLLNQNSIGFGDIITEISEKPVGEVLLTPTKLYVKSCLEAIKKHTILGLCHITGGGLTENLPRVLNDHLSAEVDLAAWELPALFAWMQQKGDIDQFEMLRTFNCGIGMVLIAPASEQDAILATLKNAGEDARPIGQITKRNEKAVTYVNAESW